MGILDFEFPAAEPAPADSARYDWLPDPFADSHFTYLGRMPWKRSLDVGASPIGIGYETLDRDTFDPAPTYAHIARSGAKWARLQSGWDKTETVAGVYDFAWLDRIVDDLIAIGVRPWISLSYGNAIHTPVEAYETFKREHPPESWPHHVRGYVGEAPIYHGPAAVAAWRRYVRAIAGHFKGRVAHWEVWNEPNSGPGKGASFWCHQGKGVHLELEFTERIARISADYVELVRISAEEVRAEIPDAKIVAGAITNDANATNYVIGLARAGLGRIADVISFHPYGYTPEFNLAARHGFIRHNLRGEGRELAIWQGECGRVSHVSMPGSAFIATEYNQAKFLVRRFVADVALGMEVSSFFNVSDFAGYRNGGGADFDYGIISRREGRPKLAFDALQSMGYLFDGIAPAPDLLVHLRTMSFASQTRHNLTVAQFRRKGVPLFSLHFPEHPDLPFEPGEIDLQFHVQDSDVFTRPVVVDPVRRTVWKPGCFDRPVGGHGCLRIKPFPFTDYPLFLTDLSALEDADARWDDAREIKP